MNNLVIDFGNTRTKAAMFIDNEIVYSTNSFKPEQITELRDEYNPNHTIVSSVSIPAADIESMFGTDVLILSQNTDVPFKSNYKTPKTLGLDRIAAVAGAQFLHAGQNCLVIDAGTCITYDFVDAQGLYHGGGISPGINMRFKSLNTFTANLPLVSYSEDSPLIGQSTKESIQSGVVYGILGEIEGIIRMYKDKFADLQIIMCGGDTNFFDKKLKANIFATPELVLIGLNRILQYNA